jgi:hypothetical protein
MTLLRNIGVTDYIGNVQLVVVLIPSFIPHTGNIITTDYHRGITSGAADTSLPMNPTF